MAKQAVQHYQSFLVRCWLTSEEAAGEPPLWRFELQEVSAELQKHRFSDLEELKTFISARLTAVSNSSTQIDDTHES